HIELIERCVGWFDDRPKDARELLGLLTDGKPAAVAPPPAPPAPMPPPPPAELPSPAASMSQLRRQRLRGLMEKIDRCHLAIGGLSLPVGFPIRALLMAGGTFLALTICVVYPAGGLAGMFVSQSQTRIT